MKPAPTAGHPMRRHAAVAALVLAVALAVQAVGGIVPAQGQTPPSLPHVFYGSVTIGGTPAPGGVLLQARIDGFSYAQSVRQGAVSDSPATGAGGTYGQDANFQVCADNTGTEAVEGGVSGDVVAFFVQVDGQWHRAETSVSPVLFEPGGSTRLDLSVGSLDSPDGPANPSASACGPGDSPTPTVTPTQTPTPTSTPVPDAGDDDEGDGGTSSASRPADTPTPTPTSTPSPTPSPTPAPTATATPTPIPTPSPMPTPQPTVTPTPSPTATATVTPTHTPEPTAAPTIAPVSLAATPTGVASPTATATAAATPPPLPEGSGPGPGVVAGIVVVAVVGIGGAVTLWQLLRRPT